MLDACSEGVHAPAPPLYASTGFAMAAIATTTAANLLAALFSPHIRPSLGVFALSLVAPIRLLARRESPH